MRVSLALVLAVVPLALCAAPAAAQEAPPPMQLPPQLSDPATADRLANAVQSLSGALLDLHVGDVRAALEGRKPTAADRRATVGSETGLSVRELNARIAAARPQIDHSIKALNQALPEIAGDLQRAQRSIGRAISNMPDPNYPRR
jgi:hypothetical protein